MAAPKLDAWGGGIMERRETYVAGKGGGRSHASPFGIVPTRAVFDERISPAMLRVLMALATYADERRLCHPAQGTVADRLHVSRQAVAKQIQELVKLGYLEKVNRRRDDGGDTSCLYRIVFDQPDTTATEDEPPASIEAAIPVQPEVAPPQRDVSPVQLVVAPPVNAGLQGGATSEVAPIRTDQGKQTKRTDPPSDDRGKADEEGAGAPVVAVPPSLCSQIAKAAKLAASADDLEALVRKHIRLGADGLILEAQCAAEWIADPSKNKGGKRTMSIRFLHNWLSKAETPPPQASAPAPPPHFAAVQRQPPAFRDGRTLARDARPAPLPVPVAHPS